MASFFKPLRPRSLLSSFTKSPKNPVAVQQRFLHTTPTLAAHMPLTAHIIPGLKDPSLLQPYPFINNEFRCSSASGETFDVTDPANGAVIASVPDQTAQEAIEAIEHAATAFKTFRRTTPRVRARLLRAWYDLIIANKDDLATIITWENGKPLADAHSEVIYAASFIEWFSEEAPRLYGDTIPVSNPNNRVVTLRQPIGVCGLITPWNFPAAMITRKIGPALAAGCTTVCKAPAETPLTSLALAQLARRAAIPAGVINILTSNTHTAAIGRELCASPTIKKLSFTGSTPVGKLLMSQAASSLTKCSFELGGNAPFIVFSDCADLDAAVQGALTAKFRSSGQTCVCANRIFVHDAVYDDFCARFAGKVRDTFAVGSGFDTRVTHGPLIHDRAVRKVDEHVRDAVGKGAKLLVGGRLLEDLGANFYAPTVLRDMTGEMAIQREETFGPVAAIWRFKSEKEVVEMANDSEVGLAGYFYSRDIARIWRVAEALEVGMVGVNTGLISDPAAPFGGVKESGFGREGSKYGIDEYATVKKITFGGLGGDLEE